jgi:hypothetical protein
VIAKKWTIELPSGETELALWGQVLTGAVKEAYLFELSK